MKKVTGRKLRLPQKIFFKGQIYNAHELIIDIIKTAENKIESAEFIENINNMINI